MLYRIKMTISLRERKIIEHVKNNQRVIAINGEKAASRQHQQQ